MTSFLNTDSLFDPGSFYCNPFKYSIVKNLFHTDTFESINDLLRSFCTVQKNKSYLCEQMNLFSKELASRSKAPAITYHRNRWAELGINPSLHDAIDTALTSNRSKIFSHYHQSRFSSSYSNQIFFNFTPPLFSFPIHDDARIKCWTLAYYFYPESNSELYFTIPINVVYMMLNGHLTAD